MNNPWLALSQTEPFVLEEDRQAIAEFNKKARSQYELHLEVLPEPFLGQPHANVVFLNLNPGFATTDYPFHKENTYFIDISRKNLNHEPMDYPFYLLDPQIAESPGAKWWSSRLKRLIQDCDRETVAQNVLVVELFPYHSESFGFKGTLPSQHYSFHLVRAAMERNAVIIQMRSQRQWFEVLPELRSYPNYFMLNNVQQVYVTPNNCPQGYSRILDALSGHP